MSKRTESSYSSYEQDYSERSKFDVKILWVILQKYKYWFIASVLLCLAAAFVYLRYKTPQYSVSTKVLIKDKEHTYYSNSLNNTFAEMGLTNSSNGFDNELEIIATKTMNKIVVKKLKFYTVYYVDERLKDKEIYGKYSPYLVDIEEELLDSLRYPIQINMQGNDKGVEVKVKSYEFEDEKIIAGFPAHISTPYGKVLLEKNSRGIGADEIMEKGLKAVIYPLESAAFAYANALTVTPTSRTTTIAELSLIDNIPDRSCDYLNKLIEVYNEDANIDNNVEATRTRDFIEERLSDISKDLNMTEAQLAEFKRNSGILDSKVDVTIDANQNVQYEQKLVDVSSQISLIDYLIEYCDDKRNALQVLPSNIGLIDNNLNGIINKYNEAILERNKRLRSASEDSPSVTLITNEAEGYLSTLRTSLRSAKRQMVMQRNELQNQQNKYTSRISSAPSRERELAGINRQQEVKAGLYLMLLQKREENLITLSSAAYKAKQIEEPIVVGPVSPKKRLVLIGALLVGFLLPYLYYYLRNIFRYRIEGEEDLTSLCQVPLLGTVPFVKALSKSNRTIVLKENRNSLMMEVYRSLRSNLPFVMTPEQQVIMFTSSQPGEGKTCIASNLGTSMAFAGKKVLIMGLDIRKPRLAGLFNLSDTDKGISNFLSRKADDYEYLDSLIQKTEISANLDILPAGTIPPNPAELLERDNLESAVTYLKAKYDYILMDTAPVGLVSDTLTIAKQADVVLYIVRSNYTLKADVEFVNTLYENKRMPNINIILNAVKQNDGASYRHYGYGKRYGFGYGYGYGDNEKLEEV